MTDQLTEYDIQAQQFLNDTGSELEIKFKEFGSMLWDTDGQKRNIFEVVLSNDKGSYTFDFGDSLANSCKETPRIEIDEKHEIYVGIKVQFGTGKWGKPNYEYISAKFKTTTDKIRSLSYSEKDRRHVQKEFNEQRDKLLAGSRYLDLNLPPAQKIISSALDRKRGELQREKVLINQDDQVITPSAYSLLACLDPFMPETFGDFCLTFGYDEDSRRAYSMFERCRKQAEDLAAMYNETELEQLSEIA